MVENLIKELAGGIHAKITSKHDSICILAICSGGQYVGKAVTQSLIKDYKINGVYYKEIWTDWKDGEASIWKTDFDRGEFGTSTLLVIVDDVVWSGRQFVAVKKWLGDREYITATLLDVHGLVDISAIGKNKSQTPKEQMNKNPFIETFRGTQYTFLDPKPEQICLLDIAHALGNKCRFNGQCKEFYSVAQHSVFTMYIAKHLAPNFGNYVSVLLHDAHEAYGPDLARPIKNLFPDFRKMEAKTQEVIDKKYKLQPFHILEQADLIALNIEAHYLMTSGGIGWDTCTPWGIGSAWLKGSPMYGCWNPMESKRRFLEELNLWGVKD